MVTRVAITPVLASFGRWGFRPTPYDWVPLAVIIALIVLIFVRVYVVGDRSASGSGHRGRHRTVDRASHAPEPGEDHGHPARDHNHQARNHGHHSEPKRRSRRS